MPNHSSGQGAVPSSEPGVRAFTVWNERLVLGRHLLPVP